MTQTQRVTAWCQPGNWAGFISWIEMASPIIPDHLRAAADIKLRLTEEVSLVDPVNIHVVASLGVAVDLLQVTPALFVIPWDESVEDDDPMGMSAMTDQGWMVFIVARQVEDLKYGSATLSEAGMIQTQVLRALQGWTPPGFGRGMRRRPAPRFGAYGGMVDFEKGTAAIPLCFTLPIYLEGTVNADPA